MLFGFLFFKRRYALSQVVSIIAFSASAALSDICRRER